MKLNRLSVRNERKREPHTASRLCRVLHWTCIGVVNYTVLFNRNSVFFSIILIINQVFESLLLPIPAKLDKSLDVHITYR
jgi:hypothetical protein